MAVKIISPVLRFLDLSEHRCHEKLSSAKSRGGELGLEIRRLRGWVCSLPSHGDLPGNTNFSISLSVTIGIQEITGREIQKKRSQGRTAARGHQQRNDSGISVLTALLSSLSPAFTHQQVPSCLKTEGSLLMLVLWVYGLAPI